MSDIDELKKRAEKIALPVKVKFETECGDMFDCLPEDQDALALFYFLGSIYPMSNDEAREAISCAEYAARIAVERTKASARVCDGCNGHGYLRMYGLQNSAGNCEKCKGKGVRFEEAKS